MASTVKKLDVLFHAADLIGDQGVTHPEYERAIAELTNRLMETPTDDTETTVMMLRALND